MANQRIPSLSDRTVGFIGLGLMGEPMARRLHAAGATLVVPRRSADAVAELHGDRLRILDTPAEIAGAADLLILMLPTAAAVESVCLGPDGLDSMVGSESLVMDMGTTDAATTERVAGRLRDRGAGFVDAPVTGGRVGASNGRLTIFRTSGS